MTATAQKDPATEAMEALKRENETLRLELAQTRERLTSIEGQQRRIFEEAPLAYHSLDTQACIRTVSQGWLDLFGYGRDEVQGSPFDRFVAPECLEPLRRNFLRLQETGRSSGFECVGLRKNGERFTFCIDGMAVREPDGRLRSTHCLVRDITAEKTAQNVLEQSESFYRAVFDNAAMPIAIARNLVILYANQAMAGIVGLEDPAMLVGQGVLDHLPPRERALFAERARRRALGEAVPQQYETQVQRRDGSLFPALASVALITLPDGPATIGFFQDITEQNRIAESLLQSELRFRRLFDEVPAIAVQGYAQDRSVIYWNAASEALYGYRAEEALGRKLDDLIIPPPLRSAVVESIRAWVEEGVGIPSGELELMRKDGSLVPVFSCHVMQERQGERSEFYCLDVDLSELHAVQQELTRARDAAESANMAKSEFLANMSHEIRTPMNGVLGMLQLLMGGNLVGEQREFVELAYQSSRRLLNLLNDILDFSRIESGKLTLVNAPFRLRDLMDSVLRVFALNAERRGLALSLNTDQSFDGLVLGDEARLRQILFNLVGNAVKFTRQGSVHMQVWTRPEPGKAAPPDTLRVYFSVSDTGVGIPENKIRHVFERFTQTDSSYTRQFEGAGLGLAIVKRIVDLMGGHIVMDSEVDTGTTVSVHLPLRLAQAAASRPVLAAGPECDAPCAPLRVLVAEDDRISQMYMRQQLTRLGHKATVTSNGQEAMEALLEAPYDCVLMDVQMPVMDGLEATSAIRGHDDALGRGHTHIIAMTAYALSGDREKFLRAGMDDYVSKPVQVADLIRALECVPVSRRTG